MASAADVHVLAHEEDAPAPYVLIPNRRTLAAKRVMDLTLGSVLALAAIPVILALMVLMAWSLRAWPLFVQRRIGRYGRGFWFPKIRTLPRTIREYTSKYEFGEEDVPRIGRLLRRTHLDELPQLLLVPLGTMSLVGPRPKMPDATEPIDPDHGRLRVQVRQGCTGLWQIGAHANRQVSESPSYDLFYLRYGSLRLDLWILWRTAISFLHASGIQLDQVPNSVRARGFVAIDIVHEFELTAAHAVEARP